HRAQEVRAIVYERWGLWKEARAALLEARAVQRDLVTRTKSDNLLPIIAEFTRPEIALRHAQIALRLDPPDYEEAVIALEEGRTQAIRHLSMNRSEPDGMPPLEVAPVEIPKLADIASCITDANMALVYLAAGTNVPLGGALATMDYNMLLGV